MSHTILKMARALTVIAETASKDVNADHRTPVAA
jgi:hypothetical protein